MKANLLQLVSTSIILGLMGGAVGIHWYQIGRYETIAPSDVTDGRYMLVSTEVSEPINLSWDRSAASELPATSDVSQNVPSREMNATLAALGEIVSVLQDLKSENKDLREQIQEANRDASEMRMQLEIHSRSFRPLSTGSEPAHRVQVSENHPLLPPKNRW